MSILIEFKKEIKRLWDVMGEVPNCPTCQGTGKPTGNGVSWSQTVWWQGQKVLVCHHCMGKGKV